MKPPSLRLLLLVDELRAALQVELICQDAPEERESLTDALGWLGHIEECVQAIGQPCVEE